ncbi:class I SAM-dependent methyltransferase [Neorhizobium galegae]|uniref:class I SAM-dependent methyltransferase n=1 Tax=Neorhizobium galegae TaxID=399 RepID=UPI00210543DD|nr:class I SAM-dependent methyltransferase [Neorhizobium galegae]MCQ1855314.1 methyltransferase domain-containing protein [Neorhizobium galegae]
MSGFDRDWLALREPVDGRARDAGLLATAIQSLQSVSAPTILDIGCGTGSTFRALSPKLQKPARFRLFDDDQRLLDEANRLHGEAIEIVRGDLNEIEALPLADVGLVTASALFDLCSEQFIRRFVAHISQRGASLYAALNYDGRMRWSKPHPLDETVLANFNAHQLSDKGFGLSLGPRAWATLADCLGESGYTVTTAESPWAMTVSDRDLQRLFLDGMVRAVYEYGQLDESELRDWADFRRKMVDREGSLCQVGHQDILAIR